MRLPAAGFFSGKPDMLLSTTAQGFVFAFLATIVWSFNFVAGRGLVDAMPPCTLAFGRWFVAFCAVLPFAIPSLRREWRHFFVHWRYYLIVSAIGIAYFNTAIYSAAHSTTALNLSLIATSSPLFTVLLARIFFGEGIGPARIAGIAVALAGIALLLSRGDLSILASLSFRSGDLLMLSAALGFSLYTLLVRKQPKGVGQASCFAVTFGLGALMLLPLVVHELAGGGEVRVSPALVGGLLYMGLGASLLAFWCWARAIGAIGPSRASIIYYSLPLFSGIEAVLFLGEPVLWVHFVSGALILGGLVLATRDRKGGN